MTPPTFFKKARKVRNYDLYANHAWYVPGVGGMFALLGWFLLGNILAALLVYILRAIIPGIEMYTELITYPLSFIPPMIYAARKSQRNSLFEPGYKLNSSNFGPFKGWQLALITVLLTFATMVAADLPNYWNFKLTNALGLEDMYNMVKSILEDMTGGPFWSSFLLVAIFAPIFEEWLCRGMVLRGLLTKMKPVWAIVVSALFFALIHLNPWQALNAFIIGVIMGVVYYRTGSLLLTMLIHFVNNGFAVLASQFFPSMDEMDFWIDMMPLEVYIPVYVAGVAVLAACIWAFTRIPLKQERGNIDEVELTV